MTTPGERPGLSLHDERPGLSLHDERPGLSLHDQRPGLSLNDERPGLSLHGERPVSLGVHDERPGRLSLTGERLGLMHVTKTCHPPMEPRYPDNQTAALLGVYFLGVLTGAGGLLLLQVPPLHSGLEAAGRPNQDFFYLFLEKYLCLFLFYKPSKLIQFKKS